MMWANLVRPNLSKLALLLIIILAGCFRLYGLNWDQDQHLHPDERFLTMVATGLQWPNSLSQYFDTARSTLNPHNMGFSFYVYGTWPVILVKYLASLGNWDNYVDLTLVGRAVSAVFDLGTLIVVSKIASLIYSKKAGLWTALVYAAAVLPIQLSHFFATDTFAVFCLCVSVLLLLEFIRKPSLITSMILGTAFGLALTAKLSSVVLLPTLFLGFLIAFYSHKQQWRKLLLSGAAFGLVAYMTVRLTMPYLFADSSLISWHLNPKVLSNIKELKSFDNKEGNFPPATMWINSSNYLFPAENMLLWGWGLPLFSLGLVSLFIPATRKNKYTLLITFAILTIFAYQGGQFVKPMRYFYVLYPLMAILMGALLEKIKRRIWVVALLLAILVWPISYVAIYSVPHSRVSASMWIYANIPAGSHISCEHWDDCLPLNLLGYPGNGVYTGVEYTMFYPDTDSGKWIGLIDKLKETDYIILSSNRVYGSTMTVPEKYQINKNYYSALFAGELGFEKIAEFTSRPRLPIPGLSICLTPPGVSYGKVAQGQQCLTSGISFVDDYADESFTVYDHPKVLIFKKVRPVDYGAAIGISPESLQ